MSTINLSFIIATRNRLSFLKILLERLVIELGDGEEIVVVDAESTDGAKEYLQQLFEQGKIHQYISEPDRNQAHGWNKAMLMARGTIIKKLIDDDVHNFAAIRKCSEFMLANPAIDVCISNHLETNLVDATNIGTSGRLLQFTQWKNGQTTTFTFSDVTMLVRRSSLSFLGLYDVQFRMMDWEYSLRVSYLQANLAYYTGYNSMAVSTPGNVTSTATAAQFLLEENIGKTKYGYAGDSADISLFSKFKIGLGKMRYRLSNPEAATSDSSDLPSGADLQSLYDTFYQHLEAYNKADQFEFIY